MSNDVNFVNVENVFLIIYTFFANLDAVAILNAIISGIVWIRPIALVLSLLFIVIMIYSRIRQREVIKGEDALLSVKKDEVSLGVRPVNEKWIKVMEHIGSPNPNDWRMAIFEADILLNEALEKAGYGGDTIGDKLKSVDPSGLLTLDLAWDAHKIRNLLAHEGSSFDLNDRESKRVIDEYQRVLKELNYI